MSRSDTKRELEALIKVAEKNRAELQKSWKKVAALEADIQSAKRTANEIKPRRKQG